MYFDHPPNHLGEYKLHHAIATTQNSYIYAAVHPKVTQKLVAKIIPFQATTQDYLDSEPENQTSVESPFVMPLLDIFDDQDFRILIMETASLGNLKQIIEKNNHFSTKATLLLAYRLINGLNAIHRKSILHGDIKPENIVIDGTLEDPIPRYIDFGHSKRLGDQEQCNCKKLTCTYSAPEILKEEPHTYPSDVWSLGCVLFYITNEKNPLNMGDLQVMIKATKHLKVVSNEKRWTELPEGLAGLIEGMTRHDPEKRYTLEKCLNHPVFSDKIASGWRMREDEMIASYVGPDYFEHSKLRKDYTPFFSDSSST